MDFSDLQTRINTYNPSTTGSTTDGSSATTTAATVAFDFDGNTSNGYDLTLSRAQYDEYCSVRGIDEATKETNWTALSDSTYNEEDARLLFEMISYNSNMTEEQLEEYSQTLYNAAHGADGADTTGAEEAADGTGTTVKISGDLISKTLWPGLDDTTAAAIGENLDAQEDYFEKYLSYDSTTGALVLDTSNVGYNGSTCWEFVNNLTGGQVTTMAELNAWLTKLGLTVEDFYYGHGGEVSRTIDTGSPSETPAADPTTTPDSSPTEAADGGETADPAAQTADDPAEVNLLWKPSTDSGGGYLEIGIGDNALTFDHAFYDETTDEYYANVDSGYVRITKNEDDGSYVARAYESEDAYNEDKNNTTKTETYNTDGSKVEVAKDEDGKTTTTSTSTDGQTTVVTKSGDEITSIIVNGTNLDASQWTATPNEDGTLVLTRKDYDSYSATDGISYTYYHGQLTKCSIPGAGDNGAALEFDLTNCVRSVDGNATTYTDSKGNTITLNGDGGITTTNHYAVGGDVTVTYGQSGKVTKRESNGYTIEYNEDGKANVTYDGLEWNNADIDDDGNPKITINSVTTALVWNTNGQIYLQGHADPSEILSYDEEGQTVTIGKASYSVVEALEDGSGYVAKDEENNWVYITEDTATDSVTVLNYGNDTNAKSEATNHTADTEDSSTTYNKDGSKIHVEYSVNVSGDRYKSSETRTPAEGHGEAITINYNDNGIACNVEVNGVQYRNNFTFNGDNITVTSFNNAVSQTFDANGELISATINGVTYNMEGCTCTYDRYGCTYTKLGDDANVVDSITFSDNGVTVEHQEGIGAKKEFSEQVYSSDGILTDLVVNNRAFGNLEYNAPDGTYSAITFQDGQLVDVKITIDLETGDVIVAPTDSNVSLNSVAYGRGATITVSGNQALTEYTVRTYDGGSLASEVEFDTERTLTGINSYMNNQGEIVQLDGYTIVTGYPITNADGSQTVMMALDDVTLTLIVDANGLVKEE